MAALIRRRHSMQAVGAGVWSRGPVQTARQIRALRASAVKLDPTERRQTALIRSTRQPWQTRAFNYRREIGELRYAINYQGNAARRMLLYPAVYVPGERLPIPIEDSDLSRYAALCHDALDRIGDSGGRANLLRKQTENFGTVGEAYLISRMDRGNGVEREVWEIRSLSEIHQNENGQVVIRDLPGSSGSASYWGTGSETYTLQADDFLARLWWPDPEYGALADSPVRSAEPILEELTILSKDVRAAGVSRLASNGILLLPDTLTVNRDTGEEAGEGLDDPFMSELIEAATEAISDPGSAAAAIPIVMRGPASELEKARHVTFARPEADNSNKREEALRRLATSLDLPAEVLSGMGDLNHWTAWQVDDSTFRHHLEPLIQVQVDAWTSGYLHPYLGAAGLPPEVVVRICCWYDPTELLTKPDKSQDAKDAFDKHAISLEALRRYLGFTTDDAPEDDELVLRMALAGPLDPGLSAQLARLLDPRLEEPEPIAIPPAPGMPEMSPEDDGDTAGPAGDEPPDTTGPPDPNQQPNPDGMAARVVALQQERRPDPDRMASRVRQLAAERADSDPDTSERSMDGREPQLLTAGQTTVPFDVDPLAVSERLARQDAQLRERLRQACESALARVLERAGAKVITRVKSRDGLAASACRDVPAWSVPAKLGPAMVAALGLTEDTLLQSGLDQLHGIWERYVETGQQQAIREAAKLIGMDVNTAFGLFLGRFKQDRAAGWSFLRDQLTRTAQQGLIRDPNDAINSGQLVPTGAVRGALAIAGGFNTPTSQGINADTLVPNSPLEHYGQIGTGTTIRNMLEENGATVERYQWEHGFSIEPFPPHEKLAGYQFDRWDDSRLMDHASFPGPLHPGDHKGCNCDAILVWVPPETAAPAPTTQPVPPARVEDLPGWEQLTERQRRELRAAWNNPHFGPEGVTYGPRMVVPFGMPARSYGASFKVAGEKKGPAWFNKNAMPELTEKQLADLKVYTTKTNLVDDPTNQVGRLSYHAVNAYLRGTRDDLTGELQEMVDSLKSAMRPLPSPVVLRRGVHARAIGYPDFGSIRPGELLGRELVDLAFLSTTAKGTVPAGFRGVHLELHVPAGTRGVWIGGTRAAVEAEQEFLLEPGLKWRVRQVIDNDKEVRLVLELAGHATNQAELKRTYKAAPALTSSAPPTEHPNEPQFVNPNQPGGRK